MSAATIAKQVRALPPVAFMVGGVLIVVAGWAAYKGILAALRALRDFNKDTPYEGGGVVGTLGNAVNQALGGIPQNIGEALSSGLYELFHGGAGGDSVFYLPTFPDGTRHSIAASAVDSRGRFVWDGSRYQLTTDAAGKRWAFPA